MYILFFLLPMTYAGVPSVFKDAFVLQNQYRLLHNVQPLKWSEQLANKAQEWADFLNLSNSFTDGMLTDANNNTLGQNIGATFTLGHQDLSKNAKDTVDIWYSEKINYNYEYPELNTAAEHFSQMVWNNTQYVGFGISNTGPRTIIVADYYPAGNIVHQYKNNVYSEN